MAPVVLLVHGFWEGPTVYDVMRQYLSEAGLRSEALTLPAWDTELLGNPTMKDDIVAIRQRVKKLVNVGKKVILVLHSGAGFLGSEAIKGLDVKSRESQTLDGGVEKLVFITAALFPEGFTHGPLPINEYDDNRFWCTNPEQVLFNDLPSEEAQKWIKVLKCQPAQGWDETVTYCGWRDVPSVYIICEKDNAIPYPMQESMAQGAGSKIERVDAGHMAHISKPKDVARIVIEAAGMDAAVLQAIGLATADPVAITSKLD